MTNSNKRKLNVKSFKIEDEFERLVFENIANQMKESKKKITLTDLVLRGLSAQCHSLTAN